MTKYKWLNRLITADLSGFFIAAGCISVLLYAIGYFLPSPGFRKAGAAGLFLVILLFLLHMQFHECDRFLSMHPATDQIPKDQMKLVNGVYLAAFLALTGAAMAVFSLLKSDWLINGLKSILGAVLRFLARLLPEAGPVSPPETVSEPFLPPVMGGEAGDPSLIARILDVAVQVFGAAVLILLAAYLLRSLFLRLLRFLKPREDGDEKEFIKPDAVFGKTDSVRDKGTPLWRDFSVEGRIRRAYKKEILRRLKHGERILQTETPSELESKTDLPKTPSSCGVYHELYEKARYGKGCGKEDIERLKTVKDAGGM